MKKTYILLVAIVAGFLVLQSSSCEKCTTKWRDSDGEIYSSEADCEGMSSGTCTEFEECN